MLLRFVNSILIRILPEKSLFYLVGIYDKLFSMFLRFLISKNTPKFIVWIFKSAGIRVVFFENIKNYAAKNPQGVKFIFKKNVRLYYSHPSFDHFNLPSKLIKSKKHFNQYGALIKNATLIGGSNLILLNNGKAIYDTRAHDVEKRYRYTDGAIIHAEYDSCLTNTKKSSISYESAIYIGGNFSFNYYHLLFEILVKFEQIESLCLENEVPILADKICLEIPQYKELFHFINQSNREIVAIENQRTYSVKNLYHISSPNLIPPNFSDIKDISATDVSFNLNSLNYLRSIFLDLAIPTDFPKKIFLSRRKASNRRKFNEKEVIQAFEKQGFSTVFPEDYSIAEQIFMFHHADFIAGGSGGAFTNLLFCKKGCKVICLSNYAFDISLFSTIANYVGVDMIYINDDSKNIQQVLDLHESFTIDLKKLEEIIL